MVCALALYLCVAEYQCITTLASTMPLNSLLVRYL